MVRNAAQRSDLEFRMGVTSVKPYSFACAVLLSGLPASPARAVELPGSYFELMEAACSPLAGKTDLESSPGVMLSAAVLYTRQHPKNRSFGDREKLELALRLGDLFAHHSENDPAENRQDYEWEIHFWLDTYRLLEAELGAERRELWRRELEKNVRWFEREVRGRLDFPRYQGPYIRTSTNHLALFASTVYLAGRFFPDEKWESLGARAMHRLAAEEQTSDGFWAEFTDNGPTTGYNYITLTCVALYWEHSRDTAALEALRRATDFHRHFTWPDGTPVETINGRNRHWGVSAWGHFAFSNWPDGRGYAEFLADFFAPSSEGSAGSRNLGRLAQSALYYHEGPVTPSPQKLSSYVYRMQREAGIRRSGPWTVCLSGLIDVPVDSQFTLDRQGHMSIFHDQLGMIITGANSKRQPELATFLEKKGERLTTIPLSARLRLADDRDRLGLGYHTFFAEAEIPKPERDRLPFRFVITEVGPSGRIEDAQLNLQLNLTAGEVLETATRKITLDETRIELGPDEIGGWIRHRGWKLRVDPAARLIWPILPFNPYRDAPETQMQHAVARLWVPVKVAPPEDPELHYWQRQGIEFVLETGTGADE